MNGRECYAAVLNNERPSKIPIRVANYNMFVCHYYGITIEQYLEDPSRNAEVLIKFLQEFEVDSIKAGIGYIFYGCGPEMGPGWHAPEGEFPVCVKGVIDEPADMDKIKIPAAPEGYFKRFLEINQRVRDRAGKEVFLGVSVLGPFSAMCFLRGYESLLMDMAMDLDFFTRLLKKGEEVSAYIGRHCLALELPWINLMEIFLIPGVINPAFYHEHIAPHDEAVRKVFLPVSLPNSNAAFMGFQGGTDNPRVGKLLYDYYFGNLDSLEVIEKAAEYPLPGYPRLVTLSARALVTWPIDRILSFVKDGLDYFIKERAEYPAINLASVQAATPQEAVSLAQKLKALARFRDAYVISYDRV
jgi:hypothetical protein